MRYGGHDEIKAQRDYGHIVRYLVDAYFGNFARGIEYVGVDRGPSVRRAVVSPVLQLLEHLIDVDNAWRSAAPVQHMISLVELFQLHLCGQIKL